MVWRIVIVCVAVLGVGLFLFTRPKPIEPPKTESDLIGVWKIAPSAKLEPSDLQRDYEYMTEHTVTLRSDHTALYRLAFCSGTNVTSGTWSLSNKPLEAKVSLADGSLKVLTLDPRSGMLALIVGDRFYPCSKLSVVEPPRRTNPPIDLPLSALVGQWNGAYTYFYHPPATNGYMARIQKVNDHVNQRFKFPLVLKGDSTFECQEVDSKVFPRTGQWKYRPHLRLIELNANGMGTAVQDLNIEQRGKALTYTWNRNIIRFEKPSN